MSTAPSIPELTPPAADADLTGRAIMYYFEEAGWCMGVVEEQLHDSDEVDDETGHQANYLVYYEVDDSLVWHHLQMSEYNSCVQRRVPRGWHVYIMC